MADSNGCVKYIIAVLTTNSIPRQSVAIITFNYDLGADLALANSGLEPNYVLNASRSARGPTIDLLKLHGSLNWATESASRLILPLSLRDFLKIYRPPPYTDNLRVSIGSQLREHFSKYGAKVSIDREPVIIPPSWNKSDYHQALTKVWSRAATHLSEAQNIFIIGYSLPETDSFFRHLYALGSVGQSPLRKLMVFDPDNSGLVDQRFRTLLGPGATARYSYHQLPFGIAINTISQLFSNKT